MDRIQSTTVPGQSALAEIERLRREFSRTGLYPILFGDEEDFSRIEENLEFAQQDGADYEELIAASLKIDATQWLKDRVAADPESYGDDIGEWPTEPVPSAGIITHRDLSTGKPKKSAVIGLLPVSAPWEVFARIGWGGWNDCPLPAEHCAMHRDWQQRYGAEVLSVTGDVVQCLVARPPRDRASSLILAREQYVYCYDIVAQGTTNISALASSLLNAPDWFFWWD
jgi:Domain of unknown function (DUF4253)